MKALWEKIKKRLRSRRFRKMWYRLIGGFGALVVFVTTYALVLPAITMEKTAACGIEEHQHDDSCYEEVLVCGQEESEGHYHDDSCYLVTKELVCEIVEHQHSAENGCYDEEGNLICELVEHVHDDSCYEEVRTLTCSLEESEGHNHDASCYEKVLVCEKEVHIHSEDCYEDDSSSDDEFEDYSNDFSAEDQTFDTDDAGEEGDVYESGAYSDDGIDDEGSTVTEDSSGDETVADSAADSAADTVAGSTTDPAADTVTDYAGDPAADVNSETIGTEPPVEEYVPELAAIEMETVLSDTTGFYYFHAGEGEEVPSNSTQIDDWRKLKGDTVLAPTDLVKMWLAYTIPAGALNETNQTARYRLPANLHLTENQIHAISKAENGITAGVAADSDEYQKYLGAEAVEGTRTPDRELTDGTGEYISAVVRAENVYIDGEFVGQDLIFVFTPYTIQKNRNTYDETGTPVTTGEEVRGWFACDFNMQQIDWVEEESVREDGTVIEKAEIVFAREDLNNGIEEIRRTLRLAEQMETEPAELGEDGDADEQGSGEETGEGNGEETGEGTGEETGESTGEENGEAAGEGTEEKYEPGTLTAEGDGYRITLDYDADAHIPGDASLSVREITEDTDKEAYEDCLAQAEQQVSGGDRTSVDQNATRFFDIEIVVRNEQGEEEKIEPEAPVRVNIQLTEIPGASEKRASEEDTAGQDAQSAEPTVLHFAGDGVETIDATVTDEKQEEASTEISFKAESFSIYGVVYTVDFHWGVNGKTYDFSIPGGGFVSLGHLIEVLGINDPGTNTENSSDSAENREDFRNETDGNSVAEAARDGGSDAYEEAIDLNKAEVGEATKQFVADVSKVEFSSPGLAWVGKVDAESTVGGLKEANGLEVKYSAELTEEQIAVINAQTVEAGDWALISVQPFKTEETLTVTMKTGEAFTIQVTDAQISTHVITADGEDYIITVIYGPEAEIPVDAVLEAEEIVEGSKEYEKYVYLTREALMNRGAHDGEDTDASDSGSEDGQEEAVSDDNAESFGMDGSIAECTASEDSSFSFARFFDIRIMAGKEKIEPKAPVTVKITYADAVDVEEGEELLAVHFAEDGTELIPIRSDRESRELTFEQGSFSVTGTVVNAGQNAWPNNGSYVLFTQIGEQCYAINHDGELVPVTRNGNQLSFEDADVLFHGMDEYLWQYERTSRYVMFQGWVNEDRLFFNVGESQNWINPANDTGIGNNRTLARTNNRIKVSNGDFYITVDGDNSHIAGLGNGDNAIPIYFANGFDNVNKVIVHFVDRNGNPISGVEYTKDNANVVASPDDDGTFAIRYNWNGATGVVDLSEDFSKTGYTYASTHLSGVQSGTTLRQDGLTIDAKLTERQNGYLYIGTDIGSNKDYLPYNDDSDREYWEGNDYIWDYSSQRRLDQTIRAAAISANARQDYATSTDKDIYVILDPAPNTLSGGGDDPTDIDADDPVFTKTLEDNGDGTYTLSLTIEGHANSINKSTNANVLFVVDTSSSMANAVGNSTRIDITREALKQLGGDLMAHNQKIANRVQVSMIAFDGGVYNRLGWTASRSEFETAVDTYITSYYLHRGTDWEDALKSALTQAGTADSDPTFVIFFTDGEPSQYSNYHGANTYTGDPVSKSYSYYFNSFLSRESCNDEARALVDSGYELYGVFAFNNSGHTYPNGEADEESDSALLHNLVKYGYNTEQDLGEDSSNQKFFPVNNQEDLEDAFEKILEMINISVGFDQVEVTDNITDLTQAGFATSFDSVNDFSYYRSGNGHGTESEPWEVWENAPQAIPNVQNNSVTWELKNPDNTPMVLEDGVSYKVSFVVWPKQADFDWVANLANGTKTWDDVVAAGLHFPDGDNPQIVRTQTGTDEEDNPIYSYSIATNKPSKNGNGEIINNGISYRKIRTELLNTLPAGAEYNTPVTTVDEQGNTVITTYTQDDGVITKTVETMKTTCFNPPEPMPLDDTKMKVKKEWEDSINLGHRADYVIFNLLVDGQPYMDRTAPGEEEKEYEIRVEEDSDWLNEVVIAPGVIRDGDVLEEGHSYTISEEYAAEGSDFYGFSFEFKSQTVRPMNIDGNLVYLIQIDDDNPAPSGAAIHAIAGRTYYEAAGDAGDAGQRYYEAEKDSTGLAALSGTNGKTSELDITKIIDKGNTNLTESDLDEETFTYRITLDIPAGSNIDGIMGYCYFEYPNGPNEPFKLFGYQPDNGTALASDIERFGSADNSKKIYRSWNTTNDRIKSQLMKTNGDGSITIKMDLTLTQKEVLRLTNLPSGTTYEIEEVYANYYKPASPSHSEEGQKPLDGEDERPYLAPNLAEQGYSVTQILEKNSNQTEEEKVTHTGTRVISGTISETNTRYYHQYTNELANVTLGELKVTKHLEGYEWSGEKYYFTLTAGTADFNDGKTPETGISPMPASNRIYLSDTSGTADKTYTFGKIRYTRPGTYQYTITETDADGNVLSGTTGANGIFYAPADTVTVTVGYDDDEHLAVKKIEGSNGNTIWSAAENSAVVTGTTTFTNSILIPIKKMDIDKKTQLSNAVFELLCGHSKLYFDPSYMILTQAQVESIIDMAVNDDGAAAAMAAEGITSTFTIGEISLKGLSLNTTYTLREIQPPDGYIIATNEATFTLTRDDDGLNISVTGDNASVDDDGITIIITNESGAALPHTGGPGTGLICLAGFMLTILAGAGLLRRRFFR